MSSPVSLDHFIGTIQIMPYECEGYVNQQTGEIFMFSDEVMRAMEEERDLDLDKYPEWQQREIKKAKEAFEDETDPYTMIPHRIGINDYDIMEAFCYGIQNERLSNKLLSKIRGSGAFRRFKNNGSGKEQAMMGQWWGNAGEVRNIWSVKVMIVHD